MEFKRIIIYKKYDIKDKCSEIQTIILQKNVYSGCFENVEHYQTFHQRIKLFCHIQKIPLKILLHSVV